MPFGITRGWYASPLSCKYPDHPWVLRYAYGSPDLIPFMMLTVGIGEILAVGVLGNGLLAILERYKYTIFRQSRA